MRNTARRGLLIFITVIMMFAMSISTFAAAFTKEKAVEKALKNAGVKASEVKQLSSEPDGDNYEVEFVVKKNKNRYEYEITKEGKIKELNIKYNHKFNSSRKKVGKSAAQKAAAKAAGVKLSKVKKGSFKFERDDGEGIYTLKFKSGKRRYEVDVLAATGKVIEIEKKFRK